MTNLYSYCSSYQDREVGKTLLKTFKRSYLKKIIISSILIFIDIFLIMKTFIWVTKKPLLRATFLNVNLNWDKFAPWMTTASYTGLLKCKFSSTFPFGLIFFLAGVGYFFPIAFQSKWSSIVISIVTQIQRRVLVNGAIVIVHTDALPFQRALVLAAKKNGFQTVCLQHGKFSESDKYNERDGFLCEYNFVRSDYDGTLIKSCNPKTEIIVDKSLFLLNLDYSREAATFVLLLGEALHTVNPDLNRSYLSCLKEVEKKLNEFDIKCAFRPHPGECNTYKEMHFKRIDLGILEDSLTKAKAVVGFKSTVLFDSVNAGIPAYSVAGEIDENVAEYISKVSLPHFSVERVINESTEQIIYDLDMDTPKLNDFLIKKVT